MSHGDHESGRIALDVMGGDFAPTSNLSGALRALGGDDGLDPGRMVLVGNEDAIRGGLEELGGDPGFVIRHASEVIDMHEKPGQALRAKPDSSIAVCVGSIKAGQAGALVSMGNTGAVVGASTLGLGTLSGVRRPGIAVTLELTGHPVTLLDMGANIAPKPAHLVHYGTMGSVLARDCLGVREPRVGLLNIGEETSKGTDLLREAHGLLTESRLDFVGNVEGGDIFKGVCDVVVTDGFTGNVVLKLLEDFAGFMLRLVMEELQGHGGAQWGPEALAKVRRNIDYSEYGGALLLGVAGIVVIGHGRSDENAVSNALRLAARALDAGVNDDIVRGLETASEPA
ncbi:MAG: phosphate acyltransferase PlsX [bacterium]|nr:phosphate acyltransferase PlsX [bacterium]